ncbi:MAG: hypothetical protein JW953_21445 [Anaerolineae bacterium]|nr:hypothetical protein [Anaerolineae bacterium]
MDQRLLTQLQSSDPKERREAILALARSGDAQALPLLKHIYQNEANPALRELARKAGQYLWQQLNHQKQTASLQPPTQMEPVPLERSEARGQQTPVQEMSHKTQAQGRPITCIMLIVALMLLFVAVIYFVQAGYLDRYRVAIQISEWGGGKRTVDGTEYYLVKPWGFAPAGGWPVVVGLHGYGGNGKDLLPLAVTFSGEGIIFVSPTFGNYEPMPGAGPIEPMKRILEEVNLAYPVDQRGAILFGFSQGGTFAYRFSVYHPELVAGVVTAGAPDLDAGEPASPDLPYVFTWGEHDGLQDFVLPSTVYPLMRRGYNVNYAVIEGAGHAITPYAIERTLQMVNAQE